MTARSRWRQLMTVLSIAVLVAAACGDSESGFDVTSDVVSHESIQDMLAFAPDAEGSELVIDAVAARRST